MVSADKDAFYAADDNGCMMTLVVNVEASTNEGEEVKWLCHWADFHNIAQDVEEDPDALRVKHVPFNISWEVNL
jgi:hypothetical protein